MNDLLRPIPLKEGDIIVYNYKGEDEYAIWLGNETRQLIGPDRPAYATRIIRGVWKKDQFHPRKVHTYP